jgi:hypothetical protein
METNLISKVALDVIYDFIVEKFFISNYLESKNIVLSSLILNFKIFKQTWMMTWSIYQSCISQYNL